MKYYTVTTELTLPQILIHVIGANQPIPDDLVDVLSYVASEYKIAATLRELEKALRRLKNCNLVIVTEDGLLEVNHDLLPWWIK